MNWRQRIDVAYSIASALKYLHSQGCSHRDIKPDNICFTEDLSRVLLIDFGLAKLVDKAIMAAGGHCSTNLHGSSDPYVAPEYKDGTLRDESGKLKFDELCEVYSFGFVLQALITGKLPLSSDLPMSSRDMIQQAQRDFMPNEGAWDHGILMSLSELAERCMLPRKQRGDRGNFDTVLDCLKPLKISSRTNPTEEQRQTIQMTLNASMYMHGTVPVSRDEGQCLACSRTKDCGLVCNGSSSHFICDRCFSEHVKKHFGEIHMPCPKDGCASEPFTEKQLVEHLEPVLVARHFEARNESRRNADTKQRKAEQESRVTNEEIVRLLHSAARARERMSEGELECPLLFVLSRPRNIQGSGKSWAPTLREPLRIKKTYILYFLCAYDKSRIDCGIVVKKNKEWVKMVAPALKLAVFCLRVGIKVGFGVSLYAPDCLENLGVEGLMDEQILGKLSDEIDTSLQQLEELLRSHAKNDAEVAEVFGEAQTIAHDAYAEVARVANEKENRKGWRDEMRVCEHNDGQAWVKRENYDKWKADLEQSS